MTDKASFSKYGKKFQENLVQVILDDRPFSDQIFEVLDNKFLELKYLPKFCKINQRLSREVWFTSFERYYAYHLKG